MALVKGSKKLRIRVIEYRLRYILLALFLLLAIVCGGVLAAYYSGHKAGMAGQEKALADVAHYSGKLQQAESRADELEQQLANIRMASQVDRQASEDVRQEVIALKDEIARLEEENSFYRGLMAPNESASGLTLGQVELISTRKERTYAYKVVIQQLATRHNVLSGSANITVLGRQDGVDVRFPLMMLSEDVEVEDIKLRFKYFQVIDGELVLPAGFEPLGIQIEAKTTGKKPQTISKKFGWLVEES